ncbi:MAG: DUF3310 domain-containing protein [Lachnospiraceae bacterium]|nr:DUF3310 domain-containing protein [Lachnospiraceae bacterium]
MNQTLEERLDGVLAENSLTENDPVNHPSHYTDGIEVIDYIESKHFPYHLGNAVKYISRAGKKNPAETVTDLRKAVWYLNRYIDLLEKSEREGGQS